MENYIINCGADRIDECSKAIELIGYNRIRSRRGGDALKVYSEEDQKRYCVGYYDKYEKYTRQMEEYRGYVATTWEEFQKLVNITPITTKPIIDEGKFKNGFSNMLKVLNPKPEVVEQERKTITLYEDRVVKFYKTATSDQQAMMRGIFGHDIFKERTYKVGMEFLFSSDKYKLIQVNSKGVSLINMKDWKNFGLVKQVNDIDCITEAEMEAWLTYHWNNFKLIEG